MGILHIALLVLYVFVCFFLILVVLVQQGKGADIAGAFGGGGTQTAFGARGATTLLHKLTTGAFIGFIALALAITILEARPRSSVVTDRPASARGRAGPLAPAPAAPASRGARPEASGQPGPSRKSSCRRGGIGRHVRLRGVWGNPCRFESGRRHHPKNSSAMRFSGADPGPQRQRLAGPRVGDLTGRSRHGIRCPPSRRGGTGEAGPR